MNDLIAYVIKNLVTNPAEVKVDLQETEEGPIFEISVAKEDVARVLGKKGRTIQAIRTIAYSIGARFGKRIRLEVTTPNNNTQESAEAPAEAEQV